MQAALHDVAVQSLDEGLNGTGLRAGSWRGLPSGVAVRVRIGGAVPDGPDGCVRAGRSAASGRSGAHSRLRRGARVGRHSCVEAWH